MHDSINRKVCYPRGVVDGADSWYPYLKQKQKGKTMNTDIINDTVLNEMVQLVMQEGAGAVPKIMETLWNLAMRTERDAHICAEHYERSNFRDGYANGYKPRTYQTFSGKLKLSVPQVRDSSGPFYPKTLE